MGADLSDPSSVSLNFIDGFPRDSPLVIDQYRQICYQNRHGIQMLLVKGYGAEQSRIRDMDTNCAHHQFGSPTAFIAHIEKLNREYNKCVGNEDCGGQERHANLMHDLFDKGVCKQYA